MICSKKNDYSLFTGCRYPSHWEFCSRVPLTLSSPPRMTSYEAWPHLKVRRERVARRPVVVPRWSISGGFRADRNVILAQGRRNDLVSSWEENFHSQHVIPFATELCCCEFLPTLSWTLNNRKWLNNGMGLDFNWFPEPWQYHMNNDRCMYTETNPV